MKSYVNINLFQGKAKPISPVIIYHFIVGILGQGENLSKPSESRMKAKINNFMLGKMEYKSGE